MCFKKLFAFIFTLLFSLSLYALDVKSVSVLFIPTKGSKTELNTILKHVVLAYENDLPDVMVITGKNEISENEKRLFYDYDIETGESYILFKKTGLETKTKFLTFQQNKELDLSFLENPLLYKKRDNSSDTDAFLEGLKETTEPMVLFLSLTERSPYDLSLWAEPSRNDVKPYWTLIDKFMALGFYDAIENSRQNTSAIGPLYTDWTYKNGDKSFRLDFLLLKNVAVSDVYTADFPRLSNVDDGVSRRGLYAHLFVY